MKILRFMFLVLLTGSGIPGPAQITFFADTLSGCDSLEVTFTYRDISNVDTVTAVDWDFGNGQTASGKSPQTVLYDSAGTYTVSITVNGNTTFSRPGYIKVHSSPHAGFYWSDSLELGSYTVVFVAAPQPVDTVPYTYQWLLEDGGTGDTRALIHRFPDAGDYRASLEVTHPVGCRSQRMRVVTVRDSLDCPNVFTPNEDGINDYFIVSSNGVTVYNLQVFSRTGVLVYKAEAPILIWDGRNLSGQELMPGTYYYIIRPTNRSGSFEKKGFVELYR
jgi:gliding motility-associated-like protein